MLIEQIIPIELRGPLVVHVLLKLDIFMTKKNLQQGKYSSDHLLLKVLQEAMYLASIPGPSH